jgi:hypothetical protein
MMDTQEAKDLAEGYKTETYGYRNDALMAKTLAESARDDAEGYAITAETAKSDAIIAQSAAEYAQEKAEEAQAAAEYAQGQAENAQSAAEYAQGQAEAAEVSAGSARVYAEAARDDAEEYASEAEGYRDEVLGIRDELADSLTNIAKNTADIRNIEKTLTEANPNGEPRVSVTTAAAALTLPKNAAPGGVDVTIKGVTLTNLVENGDFSNGTYGWRTDEDNTFSTVDGNLRIIFNGYVGSYVSLKNSVHAGNTGYVSFMYRFSSSLDGGDVGYFSEYLDTTATEWTKTSTIFTAASDTYDLAIVGSSWVPDYMEINGEYGIRVIDLTAHGLEHLTKEQLDYMTETYFDGTKSAVAPRLRSVGKNLFDPSQWETPTTQDGITIQYVRAEDCFLINGTATHLAAIAPKYINLPIVKGSYFSRLTKYVSGTVTRPNGTEYAGFHFGASDTVNSYTNWQMVDVNVYDTTKNNLKCNYNYISRMWLYVSSGVSFNNFKVKLQLEYGPAATAYEPYRESALYVEPYTLRRASGVYDEISGGKLIRRVDDTGTVLVDPEIIENVTSGALISYPCGMIFAEPALADAGIYDDGVTIFREDFPIDRLETLYKVDFQTGGKIPLGVNNATIAIDGLSFTHPELTDGDLVLFTYFYQAPAVNAIKIYSYLDSRHVIEDTTNGKYYTWRPVITNGELVSWQVTEVT